MLQKKIISIPLALFLATLPFTAMAATYTYQAGTGLVFAWGADDEVSITDGVEEYGYTEQLSFFPIITTSTSSTCTLYATGFMLKDAVKCYSYYPRQWASDFKLTSLSLPYTGQQQSANASTAHLWTYDYSASIATPSNGACTFTYHHLSAFLRITFRVPSGISGSATLTLKTKSNVIPSSTTLNLKNQGTSSETTPSILTNTLSLSLSGLTSGSTYTAYIAMPAADLSTENIDITLSATTLATIKGPHVRAGYLYNIDLTSAAKAKSLAKATPPTPVTTATSVANPTAISSNIPPDPYFTLQIIPQGILGDANNDQKVNILDITHLIKHLINGTAVSLPKTTCDTNNDGIINTLDVKGIADIIIK